MTQHTNSPRARVLIFLSHHLMAAVCLSSGRLCLIGYY